MNDSYIVIKPASQMREALDSNLNIALIKEMASVQSALDKAVEKNICTVYMKNLSDTAAAKLKGLGYTVKSYDNSDPRDNYSDSGYSVTF